jgi:hypothetical protein
MTLSTNYNLDDDARKFSITAFLLRGFPVKLPLGEMCFDFKIKGLKFSSYKGSFEFALQAFAKHSDGRSYDSEIRASSQSFVGGPNTMEYTFTEPIEILNRDYLRINIAGCDYECSMICIQLICERPKNDMA